jgi:hypothetical protein
MSRCERPIGDGVAHEDAEWQYRVKGRPHYYSPKKEEYAHIKFDLDAGRALSVEGKSCDFITNCP